ncbi:MULTISPECIES: hypothetical protein [Gluconobacter]|uniref:Transposase n=1 Tax=Gluconobacter cadivus TaxID=2728101 RepID=A0ABR9YXP1_9PROT|nr:MULTISPECIES: hypothetical protein [Gluconobacter]MBF0889331.1 hypothetical protein [Gluconobacter cadivus]MBS1053682.1 hypothetical protein [Gluconobacter kondonii]MBS1056897.1 hypothetical protein [Gluconobacter kondonii]MCP1236685.1 hypothetical protein [Gluconobacter kondonii]
MENILFHFLDAFLRAQTAGRDNGAPSGRGPRAAEPLWRSDGLCRSSLSLLRLVSVLSLQHVIRKRPETTRCDPA